MIHLDTSTLVDSLTGPKRSAPRLRSWIEGGERLALSSPVLYEWLRGPRLPEELSLQEGLFPSGEAVMFGPREAALAAQLCRGLPRSRTRAMDLAVAACALAHEATLWTLNPEDFRDVPGLRLA